MVGQSPLDVLGDPRVLLEAHAASSAYVLRKALDSRRELTVYYKRADLAPEIAQKIEKSLKGRFDAVLTSTYLFALEMTGSKPDVVRATSLILRDKRAVEDPILGQFAGHVGSRIVGLRKSLERPLTLEELKKISRSLGQMEGRR